MRSGKSLAAKKWSARSRFSAIFTPCRGVSAENRRKSALEPEGCPKDCPRAACISMDKTSEHGNLAHTLDALLGPGTRFEGTLVFEEPIRIEGEIVGTIAGEGLLVVAGEARIVGDVKVGALVVLGGTIEGEVEAREAVELHSQAHMKGDIRTPRLFIEEGARFEGKLSTTADGSEGEAERIALGGDEPKDRTQRLEPLSETRDDVRSEEADDGVTS